MTVKERVLKRIEALSEEELRELEQYLDSLGERRGDTAKTLELIDQMMEPDDDLNPEDWEAFDEETSRQPSFGSRTLEDDDFEKLRREWLFEKVADAFKDRDNVESRLEALGFTWVDDESDSEELEEASAQPENARQDLLVHYFEGSVELGDEVLHAYLAERASESPNYPLIRRYYKRGNEQLKALLLFGLKRDRTSSDLLSDLAFFHEFSDVRLNLIQHYLWACEEEQDPDRFRELVLNFHNDMIAMDFDALYQLGHMFAADSEKGQIVQDLAETLRTEANLLAPD
jgi:hypothetical protein